jgi:hypothetical protein
LAIAVAGRGQESAPAPRADDAAAILARVDARVYSAERAGMSAAAFTYRPPATGPLDLPQFEIRASWRKGEPDAVAFRNPDGTAMSDLPEPFRRQPPSGGQTAQESFERGAKGLIALFRGVPYSDQFKAWRKRLEIRVVNGREERTIVCEPAVAGTFRRVEIALDAKDLPWRVVSFLTRPDGPIDRIIDEPAWKTFDDKLLMTGFKTTRGAATEQVVVNYQRKDGFVVPSSYERIEAGKPPVRIVFEEVRLAGRDPAVPRGPESR